MEIKFPLTSPIFLSAPTVYTQGLRKVESSCTIRTCDTVTGQLVADPSCWHIKCERASRDFQLPETGNFYQLSVCCVPCQIALISRIKTSEP